MKALLTSAILVIILVLIGSYFTTTRFIIPPPILKPFADNNDWMLVGDLKYSIGNTGVTIKVPEGFVTDFASIPQPLWSFGLSPHGKYSKAAIIHDYLYWAQNCTREQADRILLIAMKESGVSDVKETEIYAGVRIAGSFAWNSNSAERSKKLPKVIPGKYQDFSGDIIWSEYRKVLFTSGITDPQFESGEGYCKYGNSKSIP